MFMLHLRESALFCDTLIGEIKGYHCYTCHNELLDIGRMTEGTVIPMIVRFFSFRFIKSWSLYHYIIIFIPPGWTLHEIWLF